MFKTRTVFIIGAGASAEIRFPTGAQLLDQIRGYLDISAGDNAIVDMPIRRAIAELAGAGGAKEHSEYIQVCKDISDAMPLASSIDKYIDDHRHEPRIGACARLAIARTISTAEENCQLQYIQNIRNAGSHIDLEGIKGSWYNALFKLVEAGFENGKLDLLFENVSFIVFNYDRCVEHFLYHAVQTYFRLTDDRAADVVNTARIFHPYGTVGKLPWQKQCVNGASTVRFGEQPQDLVAVSRGIRTFSEEMHDPQALDGIRQQLKDAQRIVFLGFSFHPMNMRLLKPKISNTILTNDVYATAFGVSGGNIANIVAAVAEFAGQNVDVHRFIQLKAGELLTTYSSVFSN